MIFINVNPEEIRRIASDDNRLFKWERPRKNKGRVRLNVINRCEYGTKEKVKFWRWREDVHPVLLFAYLSVNGTVSDRIESRKENFPLSMTDHNSSRYRFKTLDVEEINLV